MKPRFVELVPYRLPLSAPVRVGSLLLTERSGVLVRIESERGAVGWGDAAPLPGMSGESLAIAEEEVRRLGAACTTRRFPSADALHAWAASFTAVSSARFAIEAAIAEAAATEAGHSVGAWLLGVSAAWCEVNALIDGPPETWVERAKACAAAGFSCVKFKVGRLPLVLELKGLREVAAAAPGLRFRLDANRAWRGLAARAFAEELAGIPVEYLEEPFSDGMIPRYWPAHMAIAWDEALRGDGALPAASPMVKAWVVKPTLVGGLARSVRLAADAKARGCAVVFSSSYESGVGVRMLAELGAASGCAAGLDTYRALAEDVLEPRLEIERGGVDLQVARQSVVKR